jgi:hypothetical protein
MAMIDRDEALKFLEAAYDVRPGGDGLKVAWDASALLALSDRLEELGDDRAADVRELGRARFFLPAGGPDLHPEAWPRPIACGAWWSISARCYDGPPGEEWMLCWGVYRGTPQAALLSAVADEEEAYLAAESLPGMLTQPSGLRPPGGSNDYAGTDAEQLARDFEFCRWRLAAGLLGVSFRLVNNRHRLLCHDDEVAAWCLSGDLGGRPHPAAVAELRRRDPRRYRRLLRRARAIRAEDTPPGPRATRPRPRRSG